MQRAKIYLDTSFISHLEAPDAPDKMENTRDLWSLMANGTYVPVVSLIALEELSQCPEPKLSVLVDYIKQLNISAEYETPESMDLVETYLRYDVLKRKSRNDLRHIALATVLQCDYITSWNFKHFVNIRTIHRVQAVNQIMGYRPINILPPAMLLIEEEED